MQEMIGRRRLRFFTWVSGDDDDMDLRCVGGGRRECWSARRAGRLGLGARYDVGNAFDSSSSVARERELDLEQELELELGSESDGRE